MDTACQGWGKKRYHKRDFLNPGHTPAIEKRWLQPNGWLPASWAITWKNGVSDLRVSGRLAVIVSADIAGYSRLVAADEEATLTRLRAHRTEPIDPKISERGGHIASTAGDRLLIEFPSVLAAVLCAVEKQRGIDEPDVEVPPNNASHSALASTWETLQSKMATCSATV